MADKIILNNGHEIEGATIAQTIWADKQIIVTIPGNDLVNAAAVFGIPSNIEKIEYYSTIVKDTYYGYSTLVNIRLDESGKNVDCMLKGDENAYWERGYTIPHIFIPEVIADSIKEKENDSNGPESNDDSGRQA